MGKSFITIAILVAILIFLLIILASLKNSLEDTLNLDIYNTKNASGISGHAFFSFSQCKTDSDCATPDLCVKNRCVAAPKYSSELKTQLDSSQKVGVTIKFKEGTTSTQANTTNNTISNGHY